jgi:hypothetical protein
MLRHGTSRSLQNHEADGRQKFRRCRFRLVRDARSERLSTLQSLHDPHGRVQRPRCWLTGYFFQAQHTVYAIFQPRS